MRSRVIEHPVSSATDEELKARARAAIEQGLQAARESLNSSFFMWNLPQLPRWNWWEIRKRTGS